MSECEHKVIKDGAFWKCEVCTEILTHCEAANSLLAMFKDVSGCLEMTKVNFESYVEDNKQENQQVKADAVKEFTNLMIGAFKANFVDKNNPTLSEIHRCAQNHIKDAYGIETPSIIEEWGIEVAKDCGLKVNKKIENIIG